MELAAAAKVLSCHVALLCLLSVCLCSGRQGADSLNCNLSVNYRSLHGQCSVNGKPLLQFGHGKQEGNATELCPYLSKSLEETLGVMWSLQSGNDALNVITNSQYDQGKFIDGHWTINIDDKYSICFYPLEMTWRERHSDARGAKEPWKNDKELKTGLRNVLIGDFPDCLKKLLPHSREMPRSTSSSPNITQLTPITELPSPTQLPPTSHYSYVAALIPVGILFIFIVTMYKKCRTSGEARKEQLESVKLELQSFLSTRN